MTNKINLTQSDIKNGYYKIDGNTSDGYHTFDELYYHRMILFSVICNQNKNISWKSKLHSDGTMYDNYFICGIETSSGMYTYHYDLKYWNLFDVKELSNAPEWDGHKPEDIIRLLTLENLAGNYNERK